VRAVWLREFGPPSVLVAGEADEPDGEAVIDVVHANITFVETQVRAGRGPFAVHLPMIPGNGVGGTVDGGRRVIASLAGRAGTPSGPRCRRRR
jgi:NADPH2:quinone reductase